MKRSQLGLEPGVERGFLHAFVQLEKVRMPGPNADPNNVRTALAGKRAETGNGKEERLPFDGVQIFLERLFGLRRNVAEKTEGQMHLLRREPADASEMGIQLREPFGNGAWKVE